MNVLLLRWDTKADKRIERDVPTPRTDTQNVFLCRDSATRVLAWAVDVDPMVGGVVCFVDSGFWRGA